MNEKKKLIQWSHISPQCMIRMLLRHAWMIIVAAVVGYLATSLILTWFHIPQYRATMTYAVTTRNTSSLSSGNLASTKETAAVLSQLLGSDLVLDSVRGADPRLTDFDGSISAKQQGESNFIIVSATASTPEQAFLALSTLTRTFPNFAQFISGRSVLNLLRNPNVSSTPANQLDTKALCRTAALGCAAVIVLLLCYISIKKETIQTRTGARQLLDAPIIASVCHERKNRTLHTALRRSVRQVKVFSPTTGFAYTEQINTICGQLEQEARARGRKVFLITGVGESEGKSTVAANVASALALKGHNVALVDCDLRKPAMNKFFDNQYKATLPLNKLLSKPYSRDNLRQCMVRHEQLGLYMLFPINSDSRSAELLSTSTMATLIQQLRVFDYVIVDSPPMGMFPDAETLADLVDASMLVVRQDYTSACDVNDAIDILRQSKAAFLGCILNDMLQSFRSTYGYGGKYGYGNRYGYGYSGKYSHSKSIRRGSGKGG